MTFYRRLCVACVLMLLSAPIHYVRDAYAQKLSSEVSLHKRNPAYEGFYVGILSGLSTLDGRVKVTNDASPAPLNATLNNEKRFFDYALVLGYGLLLDPHRIYLGLESDFSVGGATLTMRTNDGTLMDSLKRKHHVGVSALIGLGKEAWLLYGLVGFKSVRFGVSHHSANIVISSAENVEAVRFGGGLAFALNHDVFLRSDYNYVLYGDFKSTQSASLNNARITQEITRTLKEHLITFGFFYRF